MKNHCSLLLAGMWQFWYNKDINKLKEMRTREERVRISLFKER